MGWEFEHNITDFCHWNVSFHTSSCTEKTALFRGHTQVNATSSNQSRFFNEYLSEGIWHKYVHMCPTSHPNKCLKYLKYEQIVQIKNK